MIKAILSCPVVEVFRPEQVRQMVADGWIRDGKTLAILGQYFLRERK